MMIDDYTLLKSIGKGAFGEVYLTSKEGTNQLFATKKVSKQKADSPKIKKYFINEISILNEIKHKNIIHFETIKHTVHNYYIITEYCNGGGLSDCLERYRAKYGKPFPEEIVQCVMRQIVEALKYLHGKKIIHRDIKLDNILVNFDTETDKNNIDMLKATIKVIDFGFATHLGSANLRYSTLGSPINMDPILLKKLAAKNSEANLIGYDEKADIWSLGTVCYEMLIGQGVFNAQNMLDLIKKVEYGNYHVPTHLSKEVVSFLNGMLQYSANNRLSAEELSRHYFLTKNIKDFKHIDLTKVSNKIDQKGLNINIKKNQSIWGIFKEEDEKVLIDIPGKFLDNTKPIKENEENKDDNPLIKNKNNVINININNNLNKNQKNINNNNKNNTNNNLQNNTNNKNLNNNQKNNVNNNIKNNIQNNNKNNNIKNNLQNNNKNINLNNNNKIKGKDIDYNLLRQQQKLYYQLNLQNNNYKRFANYAYNNPYGFGGINYNNNNINNNNYLINGQPKYYNANLNGIKNKNGSKQIVQPLIPIQNSNNVLVQPTQNNQLLLNQQYYVYNKQPQYIITNAQNPQNVQIPIANQQHILPKGYQPSNQVFLVNYQNQTKPAQTPIKIHNNKDQNNNIDNSKISEISNMTNKTKNLPIGSRMPKIEDHIGQDRKNISLDNKPKHLQNQQNNYKEQTKQQIQPQIIENIKTTQDYNKHLKEHKEISAKDQANQFKKEIPKKEEKIKPLPQKDESKNDLKIIEQPKINRRYYQDDEYQKKNKNINQDINNENDNDNDKNENIKNINTKSDDHIKKDYKHKNSHNIQSKKMESPIKNNQPKTEPQVKVPLDFDNIPTDSEKSFEMPQFTEPFPMLDNNESPHKDEEPEDNDDNNSPKDGKDEIKKIDSSEGLEGLIDFKLGDDELCAEPEDEDKYDNENDNNLDLPMKKIMERTLGRPTIGVPPPGTDPQDNYDNDDENDNGIFQSTPSKEFGQDDFEEI